MEENQKKKKTILKTKRNKYLEYWKPKLIRLKEYTEEKFNLVYNRTSSLELGAKKLPSDTGSRPGEEESILTIQLGS